MTLVRLVARPMLSSMFIVGGINAIKNADALADRAKPVIDGLQPLIEQAAPTCRSSSDPKNVVRIDGLIHIVGGAMLATGRAPRLSSFVLAVSLVPTTLGGHRFWEESDPQTQANQKIHFFKNVSLIGRAAAGQRRHRPASRAWPGGRSTRPAGPRTASPTSPPADHALRSRSSENSHAGRVGFRDEPGSGRLAGAPRDPRRCDAVVDVPGSKSVTNRALLLAALADGPSVVRRPLIARDTT